MFFHIDSHRFHFAFMPPNIANRRRRSRSDKTAARAYTCLDAGHVRGGPRVFRSAVVFGAGSRTPAFADEKDIILTAQPAIPISQIIATIDAARGSFPTVAFGISR
jgi:hypothetical protein